MDKTNQTTWLQSGRVPASVLRRLAETYSEGKRNPENLVGYDTELGWESVWGDYGLGLPFAFAWDDDDELEVPEEVRKQLIGQKIGSGMKFSHDGIECYVVYASFEEDRLGERVTEADTSKRLMLNAVETRYIDMEA